MNGNQIRQRLSSAAENIQTRSRSTLKSPGMIRTIELIVRFLMAVLLSGAKIFSDVSPFAVGLTAAAGSGIAGIVTLAGACFGYLISGTFYWAMRYVATMMLVFAITGVLRDTLIAQQTWFAPLIAGIVTLCLALTRLVDNGISLICFALIGCDGAVSAACAYFYKIALSPWSGRLDFERGSEIRHTAGVLILITTLLISLSRFEIFHMVSVGRTLAMLVIFLTCFKGGVGVGCVFGISLGLAMDAASGEIPFFCMAYGFCSLVSALFARRGRLVFALSLVVSTAICAVVGMDSKAVPSIMYEVFAASVVFMVLPHALMSRLGRFMPGLRSGYGIIKAREYTKSRIDQTSLAFRDLYDTVRNVTGTGFNDNDIATIFDRASDTTCRKCPNTAKCWIQNYETTVDVMNNAVPAMLERGRLIESDLPEFFTDVCEKLPEYIAAVNSELRAALCRQKYRSRLNESRCAAFNQYSDMSDILAGISSQLDSDVGYEPQLEARLQKYIGSLNIKAEVAAFRDQGGRLHAEISSDSLTALKKDPEYLEKLSVVLKTRLCAKEKSTSPGKLFLLEAEPLAASVGIASLNKEQSQPSGDKGAYFKTDEGILYVLLSDGMGTGDEASKYSGDVVRILERFLRSGVAPETSVRILNDLMLLKHEDDIGCATVDLVCVNLFSGDTNMFKYGAAPSYLKSGGRISKIKGKSLAVGLGLPPDDSPDIIKMKLTPDSCAVIVSDGVTCGLDDGWLLNMINDFSGKSPRDLAHLIIKTASEKFGSEDDMTAYVIYVSERE